MRENLTYRVVARYAASKRVAGILEAPPAMYASIMEWIAAVLAANKNQEAQDELDRLRVGQATQVETFEKLSTVVKIFQSEPTWKNYTPLYEGLWTFGHPGARWTVRDFQKMTPEKRVELQRRADVLLAHVEAEIKAHLGSYQEAVDKAQKTVNEAKSFLRPDVQALTKNSILKIFPVDLQGWRYDNETLTQQIQDALEREKVQFKGIYDKMLAGGKAIKEDPEFLDSIRETAENGRGYKTIGVELTLKPSDYFAASWSPAFRHIQIIVPSYSSPGDLHHLGKSLIHELRHFAQGYLSYAIDKVYSGGGWGGHGAGLPSRKLQTPEYKQNFDPKNPLFNLKQPEVSKAYTKLKEKGIDPSKVDWHSLDDVEFYTKLADSIDAFQHVWKEHGSPGILNHAVKLWVGATKVLAQSAYNRDKAIEDLGGYVVIKNFKTDPFFLALRRMAAGKWRKAVAEFVKAVT